jgi:tetratricopeptide (TPR) repeat protein
MAGGEADSEVAGRVSQWAEGQATLKDVRGYTDEQLHAVARAGKALFNQGQLEDARAIFQGLFAVSPRDAYFARALGVVELAAGNSEGAEGAFDVAIRLDPEHAAGFVGRAEVRHAVGKRREAQADLAKAARLAPAGDPLKAKAEALLSLVTRAIKSAG